MPFTLECPVCHHFSTNKFVYVCGTICCSEECSKKVRQEHDHEHVHHSPFTPLVLPVPTCEYCGTLIKDIPDLYNGQMYCSEYCVEHFKADHNIKSF